ncbi:hypothetical protein F5X96DRAFT_630706 [Biscogniauxia mediterranea]|nr:hypothetical protein F5X96DRAFT_630706 [Biscogniauxia mediterranea]
MSSGQRFMSALHSSDAVTRADLSDDEAGGTPLPMSSFSHGDSGAEDLGDGDAMARDHEENALDVLDSLIEDELGGGSSDDSALIYPDTDSNVSLSFEVHSDDVGADDQYTMGLDSDVEDPDEEDLHISTPSSMSESASGTSNRTHKSSPTRSTPEPTVGSSVKSPARLFPDVNSVFDWVWGRKAVFTREDLQDSQAPEDEDQSGRGQQFIDEEFLDIPDIQDICPACTTPYCQAIESTPFKSCLRLSYNDPQTHRWSLGNRYVMTETMDAHPERTEVPIVEVTAIIRRMTPVPVPNIIAGWKEDGKVIIIAERIPGQRLYDIWWHLSQSDRERIAKQVARYVDQWRRCRSDRISSLNGGPVENHNSLFGTTTGEGFGPFRSDFELWRTISRRLERKRVSTDIIQILKDHMPESSRCVLTHGDLSSTNIIIRNGKVAAITGFDNAASLPEWAETVAVHFCYCREDVQWKAILSRHMRSDQATLDWWSLWRAAEALEPNRTRMAKLIDRCRRWTKTTVHRQPFAGPDSSEDETDGEPPASNPGHLLPLPRYPSPGPSSGRWASGTDMSGVSPEFITLSQKFGRAIQNDLLQGHDFLEFLRNMAWKSTMEGDRSEDNDDEVDEQERAEARKQLEREKRRRFAMQRADAAASSKQKPGESSAQGSRKFGMSRRLQDLVDKLQPSTSSEDEDSLPGVSFSTSSSAVRPPPGTGTATPREKGWRPTSFDGSKGLRPLSLPLYPSSSLFSDNKPAPDEGASGSGSRAETIEKTLHKLSFIDEEDDNNAGGSSKGKRKDKGKGKAVERPPLQQQRTMTTTRTSIFNNTRNAPPGSLYAALQKKAAEKKGAGAGARSRSEETAKGMLQLPAREKELEAQGEEKEEEDGDEDEDQEGGGDEGLGDRGRRKGRPKPLNLR